MRRVVVLLMVLLAGCQIIINHNEFTPGADASADSPLDAPDAPSDSPQPPANVVRSTDPSGVLLLTAFVDPGGTVVSDGDWLAATPSVEGDKLRFALTYTAFSAPPNCACTTVGGNNHGCNFKNVQQGSATLTVFDVPGGLQSKPAYVTCVGPSTAAVPGLATNLREDTMLLGTLRYDRTGVNTPVVTEDGAWVGAPKPGNPPFPLPIDPAVFTDAPNCTCQMTLDGNPGGSGSNCKLESATTISLIELSESNNGGPGNPVAHDLACLGPASSQVGNFVVSTRTGGMVVASAAFDGDANSVIRQDGTWIQPDPDDVTGAENNAVKYLSTVFGGPPRCLCSSLDTEGVACHVMSAPNITDFSVHVMSTLPTTPDATPTESDFSLICIGPQP